MMEMILEISKTVPFLDYWQITSKPAKLSSNEG